MKEEIIATNTRYPKPLHDALIRLAREHKRSFNAEVMWALEQYIEREEGKQHVSDQTGEHWQDSSTR
jgi:predicted transcriptional regulator